MTTSSDLAADQAARDRPPGTGKGHKGRVAGVVAGAVLGLSLLAGGAFGQVRQAAQPAAGPVTAIAQTSGVDPDVAIMSDLGTEYDPFVISNSRPRYVAGPAQDFMSDYGTAFDPFVISNAQPRYRPRVGILAFVPD
jgi:hypothetical protein